jgi:hypothetical protein
MQTLEPSPAPRLAFSVQAGRIVVVPCGHPEDVLRLDATQNLFLYCQRCERGYDGPLILA